ncbi:PIG-L deacetylase family protein [Salinivibrio sp. VYel4]|uniref:PIG-L deacetylase family protein n=1 Tax=Salinivibrio sp. VYel4 TaxID=2490491 RepID=UPI00128C9D26|nr:PIG-L family deacetylase [Salinivibrio sp. VYel4]MPY01342.1 PIG-L family deacetylase [Salinivibrio sp. VYel4]
MLNPKRVLVLSPHTDDGEIACGGYISRLCRQGVDVYYVAFSDCKESLPAGFAEGTLIEECLQATKQLGISPDNVVIKDYTVRVFNYSRQDILDEMVLIKKQVFPDLILTPCSMDCHQDHKVIYEESIRAFKSCNILGYIHTWNVIDPVKRIAIEVTEEDIKAKVDALKMYSSQEARAYVKESYIRGLAICNGIEFGKELVEVFEPIRLTI